MSTLRPYIIDHRRFNIIICCIFKAFDIIFTLSCSFLLSNNLFPLYKINVNVRFYKCMKFAKQSKKKPVKNPWKNKTFLVLFCNMYRHLLFRVWITYRRLDFTLRKYFFRICAQLKLWNEFSKSRNFLRELEPTHCVTLQYLAYLPYFLI